jgi:hypothetical protein
MLARTRQVNCDQCSKPIEDRCLILFDAGRLIHVTCWMESRGEWLARSSRQPIRLNRRREEPTPLRLIQGNRGECQSMLPVRRGRLVPSGQDR